MILVGRGCTSNKKQVASQRHHASRSRWLGLAIPLDSKLGNWLDARRFLELEEVTLCDPNLATYMKCWCSSSYKAFRIQLSLNGGANSGHP